jgi:ATP-dependent exoDNAse (exonuclease V) beta subunit
MGHSILERDEGLRFPHLTLLKASAGSGKTHALTQRFVQFILSEKIPRNHLRNILAITFSNNAAKEMKQRILSWLKKTCLRDPETLHQLSQILLLDEDRLVSRAETLIDEILLNYSDFQVKTIDSFMASIYKASAIDLGYPPDFDILMAPEATMAYAFNRFLRRVRSGSPEAHFLEEVLELIEKGKGAEEAYLWDPSKGLLDEMKELYQKLSGMMRQANIPGEGDEIDPLTKEISDAAEKLNQLIASSDLKRRENSAFETILEATRIGAYPDLIGIGLKNPPVLKPREGEAHSRYQQILERWTDLGDRIREYTQAYAFRYYLPYLKAHHAFKDVLERTKKEEGIIFIGDINKKLSDYLDREIIPDVYFRIGETITHYLIDEFQDTSPIQWINLYPLIENSLAEGGSFFAVGDTKQAIYGFRDADYRIMRDLESTNPFSSAHHEVKELGVNYRSLERIVQFNKDFFQGVVASREGYREAAGRSGLTDYVQGVREEHQGSGYADVILCERNDEEPAEKVELQRLIGELKTRGYRYSEMAVLTHRNEDVVDFTAWLNEMNVPFISYSSLDIRTRKLTEEVFFLLTFLDSPPDNLSFAGFLLGEILRRALERKGRSTELEGLHEFFFKNRRQTPLYKLFQEAFPALWEEYFDGLFRSTGYLPLYDLVAEIYRVFDVFETFPEEEATLIKILEVIKNFEKEGMNNPADFLRLASDEPSGGAEWNIDVPAGIDAVKVMTIHKAKGLGFPVVILVLYGEQSRGFKYILDEREEGVSLLKINRAIAESSLLLERAYEEERMKELVNRLNTLYVGFTRPESELYVIGVSGKRKQFPVDLLQEAGYPPEEKKGPAPGSKEADQVRLELCHFTRPVNFSSFTSSEELNLEERKRGEFIHRVLSSIEYLDEDAESGLEEMIRQVTKESNADYSIDPVKRDILDFLHTREIRPYFVPKPGRVIGREQEFSDREGNLLRMDRVIMDEDRITVIDYKTGAEKKAEEKYSSQLKNYMRILKDLYRGREVEGMIAYVDLKEVVKVE